MALEIPLQSALMHLRGEYLLRKERMCVSASQPLVPSINKAQRNSLSEVFRVSVKFLRDTPDRAISNTFNSYQRSKID